MESKNRKKGQFQEKKNEIIKTIWRTENRGKRGWGNVEKSLNMVRKPKTA